MVTERALTMMLANGECRIEINNLQSMLPIFCKAGKSKHVNKFHLLYQDVIIPQFF